ncbi:hypothetical protein LeptoLang_13510 [Leptospira interrogans serovar Icterohaemorrhagiae]|nr:hypothetical protein LeptoLang_13510 [Leptospira interrogans serovar Icterohaemorrhagiae]
MDHKIVICGSSHILKMIYKAQIPTFFKKMNHGFFYKLKLNILVVTTAKSIPIQLPNLITEIKNFMCFRKFKSSFTKVVT